MKINKNKLFMGYILIVGSLFSLVAGQYYYFDTANTSGYPYQQGCSEKLSIKATTESHAPGVMAGLLRLQLDPIHFNYYTGNDAIGLQTYLFQASAFTFLHYTNPTLSPSWIGVGKTILHIDRTNTASNFKGTGLYGTLLLTPRYSPNDYTGTVVIVYNGDTVRTTLSYGGTNIINAGYQYAHLTGYYYVAQAPCGMDTIAPTTTIAVPAGSTKQSSLSGILLTLKETTPQGSVPYVRTGGLPGFGIWTGNMWSINNQYGVNFSTFQIYISGNGTGRYFTGGMFSPSGTLSSVASNTTWQFHDRDYTVTLSGTELFDYGIEKTITITGNIYDRNSNLSMFSKIFNAPIRPWLIPGSAIPAGGATWISPTAAIKLGIADNRAGVHSGSIIVSLVGIAGPSYGPYTFTGTLLNLSGVPGMADHPDYSITLSGHVDFPSSGTIQVSVYAEDMQGNIDTINDYSFSTRPSCVDLGCCPNISLQMRNAPPFIYNPFVVHIFGGINPSLMVNGNTGTVDCGMTNETAMDIYKGQEEFSGSAIYVSFFDLPNLVFSGYSVKAMFSGKTITLQRIYIPILSGGCINNCGGGGGGGGGVGGSDNCTLPSSTLACANTAGNDNSSSYYDTTCCGVGEGHGAAPACVQDFKDMYSQELISAFTRAYGINITSMCPFRDAFVPRKEVAKLMSMFTIQIIGLFPNTHKAGCDSFNDTKNITDEMKFFVKTACQLDLMGLHSNGKTPKPNFDPNTSITRAEFGTILSRLVYGDTYNIYTGEEKIYKRYQKHLKALNTDGIMKKIQDPFINEKRSRILLMLYRSELAGLADKYRLVSPARNGALSLFDNVW